MRKGEPQAQDSLTDQLRRLACIAEDKGLYDAADWIRDRLAELKEAGR